MVMTNLRRAYSSTYSSFYHNSAIGATNTRYADIIAICLISIAIACPPLLAMPDSSPETKPSQMIRVPTPLIGAVRELSRLHRQGRTSEILSGLDELILTLESSSSSRYNTNSKTLSEIMERLDKVESNKTDECSSNELVDAERIEDLENEIEGIIYRMEQFTDAIIQIQNYLNNQQSAQKRKKKSYYNNSYYQRQTPRIQPLTEEGLAKRLGVSNNNLRNERIELPSPHFVAWCKRRDSSNIGWEYNQDTGLYHPVM